MLRLGSSATPFRASTRDALLRAEQLLVTPVARAEIAIKLSIGKLYLPVDESIYWKSLVSRLQAVELPFTSSHAALLATMPLLHRDPFDRMIIAQGLIEGLHIATTDAMFGQYGVRIIT